MRKLEQKIAKFAKRKNEVPFAAFAAFCSNLLLVAGGHSF
jgi:hypothetical protein